MIDRGLDDIHFATSHPALARYPAHSSAPISSHPSSAARERGVQCRRQASVAPAPHARARHAHRTRRRRVPPRDRPRPCKVRRGRVPRTRPGVIWEHHFSAASVCSVWSREVTRSRAQTEIIAFAAGAAERARTGTGEDACMRGCRPSAYLGLGHVEGAAPAARARTCKSHRSERGQRRGRKGERETEWRPAENHAPHCSAWASGMARSGDVATNADIGTRGFGSRG